VKTSNLTRSTYIVTYKAVANQRLGNTLLREEYW
jgi:hypothetical protein